jgi:eukaryotic-like serine/threonine-protein kinase
VWRAADEAAGHDVAVKALGTQADWGTTDRARLRIAFGTASAVSGPGIARVYDYGELELPGGLAVPYLVRELISGRSLEERLSDGPASVDEALGVVARVADALATAHRAGVVHGNLVPANVILGPAGVTVTDFGLWALRDHLDGAPRPAVPGLSVLSYAAPERLSGEPASPAADMYSLGVLFVAGLSGIAAGGSAGAAPVMDPDEPVAPSLAALWAACLGANPRERPSAAHAAFMSRQILAAWPQAPAQPDVQPAAAAGSIAGVAAAPAQPGPGQPATVAAGGGKPAGAAEPDGAAGLGDVPARDSAAGPADVVAPEKAAGPDDIAAPHGAPGHPVPARRARRPRRRFTGRNAGPRGSSGRSRPGPGGPGPAGRPGVHGLARTLRGRGGLVALGVVAGITAAVAMLTQFLASPSAQTTGASGTPSVSAPVSQRPPGSPPASRPAPSAEVSSSVLTSSPAPSPPPPLQVLDEIKATIRRGVADGQIRQDVAVDLDNLLQPVVADLVNGNTGQVPSLVAGLRAKLATRLSEAAITMAAYRQLSNELTTLLTSIKTG